MIYPNVNRTYLPFGTRLAYMKEKTKIVGVFDPCIKRQGYKQKNAITYYFDDLISLRLFITQIDRNNTMYKILGLYMVTAKE